jgi:hypothetical protein
MAIEIVPARDPRCDVCAGDDNVPQTKVGERWSGRPMVRVMCEACQQDLLENLPEDEPPET